MKIEARLRSHKKKATPERIALYTWMCKKHLFDAGMIEAELGNIGRASIFRTLKIFVEVGAIRRVHLDTGIESYEINHDDHHHHEHMKCNICKKVLSFDSEAICKKLYTESKKYGFIIHEHSISIFGTCKNCTS